MARPKGTINLTEDQIRTIIELSADSYISRKRIAEEANCSKRTVYLWQKKLHLI